MEVPVFELTVFGLTTKMYRWWHKILIFLLFRLNWRRLFFVGVIFTTAGIFLILASLPYPLTLWNLSPSLKYLAHQPLDRTTVFIYKTALRASDKLATSNVGTKVVSLKNAAETNQSKIVIDGETVLNATSDENMETKEKVLTKPRVPSTYKTLTHSSLVSLFSFSSAFCFPRSDVFWDVIWYLEIHRVIEARRGATLCKKGDWKSINCHKWSKPTCPSIPQCFFFQKVHLLCSSNDNI